MSQCGTATFEPCRECMLRSACAGASASASTSAAVRTLRLPFTKHAPSFPLLSNPDVWLHLLRMKALARGSHTTYMLPGSNTVVSRASNNPHLSSMHACRSLSEHLASLPCPVKTTRRYISVTARRPCYYQANCDALSCCVHQ